MMGRPTTPLVLVAALLLSSACQPWYRDDLRRGQRARNQPSTETLLVEARQAHDAGHEKRAIALARDAVAKDPSNGLTYLALAGYLGAAHRQAEARFVARRGLEVTKFAGLRPIVIAAYLADDLTSAALDGVEPATVQDAAAAGILPVADLARAETLSSTDPGQALALYATWLDSYGVPDHPILRAAVDRIVTAAWADEPTHQVLSGLLAAAYREAASGHLDLALTLYSHLFGELPQRMQDRHARRFLFTAAAVKDPAAADPMAYDLAAKGDDALRAGRLGPAIHFYRRAVARAPWWSAAHYNLALLFDLAGRTDEARLAVDRARRLEASLARPPRALEPMDGPLDDDLLAPIPDSDGDGLNDLDDECLHQAEDADGFADQDGCPDLDNDQDGVPDAADGCPDLAGPTENRGCPDADRDGDGMIDRLDNCPDQAGPAASHGCQKNQWVVLGTDRLTLLDRISFRAGKRVAIRAGSRPLLDNIAAVLFAHPEIEEIRVEAHTDDRGDETDNQTLSQARAVAVVAYLIGKGIDADRLEAIGFGETQPIDSNATRQGREANQRIELRITRSFGLGARPITPPTR